MEAGLFGLWNGTLPRCIASPAIADISSREVNKKSTSLIITATHRVLRICGDDTAAPAPS
jgi:hypothetical protein